MSYQLSIGVVDAVDLSLSVAVTRTTLSTASPETCAGLPCRSRSSSLMVMSIPCYVD